MNRRDFLLGLGAMFTTAAMPSDPSRLALEVPIDAEWAQAVASVFAETFNDLMMFGTYCIEHTTEYPYIKRIDPITLRIDISQRP